MRALSRKRRTAVALAALLIGATAALLHGYSGRNFLCDDLFWATTRPPLGEIFGSLLGAELAPGVRGYRPLLWLSFLADQSTWGSNPIGYHVTNHLLHGAVAAALAVFVYSWTESAALGLIAGILFAIHPTHQESVFWIAARGYVLGAVFYVSGLIWLLTRKGRPPVLQHGVGLLLYLAAVLAYEPTLTFPAAAGLLVFLTSDGDARRRMREAILSIVPYVCVAALYLGFRWTVLSPPASEMAAYPAEKIAGNVRALGSRLLGKGFLRKPVNSGTFWVTTALFVLSLRFGLKDRRLRPLMTMGAALAFLGFLPFFAMVAYTDRYAYLSALGFVLLFTASIGATLSAAHGRFRTVAAALLCAVIVLWSRQLLIAGRFWMESSQMAGAIERSLIARHPEPAPGSAVHILAVPDFHGQACLAATHFEYRLFRAYGRADFEIRRNKAARETALRSITLRPRDTIFVWDPARQVFVRRSPEPPR